MAIAFDSASTQGSPWAHTCSGSNRFLIAYTYDVDVATTGLTYGGVAMTSLGATAQIQTWYLYNSPVGSNNFVLTGGASGGGMAASYTGVKQSGFPDSSGSDVGFNASTITPSTTVVAANCWVIGYGYTRRTGGTSNTITTDRTSRQVYVAVSGPNLGIQSVAMRVWDSNGTVATGAQTQTSTTTSPSDPNEILAASIFSLEALIVNTTVTAGQGSYSLTGQSANLIWHLHNTIVLMGQGAIALTGQTIALTKTKIISMGYGVYALTGTALTFLKKWVNRTKHAVSWINRRKT